jgi:Cu/Ag efflux protein CusF
MKIKSLLLLPAILATFVSCTTIQAETDTQTKIKEGVPGGEVVQTTRITATVTAIDAAKRKITFVTPNDEKLVLKAGPEVANFDQIRIGDQLKVTLTEKVLVRMAKPGEKTADTGAGLIGLAPIGAKPGLLTAEVQQATGTVTKIDLKKHKVTLQFADGSTETVAVRKDVDLTKHQVGEKVVIEVSEAFAILIEKP